MQRNRKLGKTDIGMYSTVIRNIDKRDVEKQKHWENRHGHGVLEKEILQKHGHRIESSIMNA